MLFRSIGIDSVSKLIDIDSHKIPIKIWDTAGQERFHTITHSFYKQCQGVLLVYDVGSRKSFVNIHKWMKNIYNYSSADIVKYLVGNKIDTPNREVSAVEAGNMAKEYNMKYFETSACTGKNITETIVNLTRDIYNTIGGQVAMKELELTVKPSMFGLDSCCGA